jgi:WXG100 family type VII secretion target
MLLFWAYAKFAAAMARLAQQIVKMTEIMTNAKSTADGLKDKWTGDDADAFQNTIGSDVLPNMNTAISTIQDFQQRLNRAQERVQRADQQAKAMVGQLSDVFSKITN